ncbi:amino acid ABC transporter substrate-binding protein [Campylobacterota bacterium]|nr:amino acid ABC transporter substrate-binding protein [Campylobacterota bacterium]
MKRLISLLVAALFLFALVAVTRETSSTDTAIDEIKNRGFLRVAVLVDNPPFGFVDSDGKNQGYDVYFARRIAKELLGSEDQIEFVPTTLEKRSTMLENNSVDIVLAGYSVTEERRQVVDFCQPYYKTAIGVISRENDLIRSVSQLDGQRLIVIRDSTAEKYFATRHPNVTLLRFTEIEGAYNALKNGEARAMAGDNTSLLGWVVRNNGYAMGVRSLGKVTPIAPAVKKDNAELRDYINEVIFKLGKEQFAHKAFYATLQPFYGSRIAPEDLVIEGGMY